MNIQILSDLHFEMHADWGRSFMSSLDPSDVDVLAIAGDLIPVSAITAKDLKALFKAFATKYPEVYYVPGNHEFYGTGIVYGSSKILNAARGIKNFHVLLNKRRGRFIGGTMWFPDLPSNEPFERYLNDFRRIADARPEIRRQNLSFQKFLEDNLKKGDIVLTHHAPSWALTNKQYEKSDMGCFYASPMDDLIMERRPALWIYGHTHDVKLTVIGQTPCVTNGFGYMSQGEYTGFKDKLVWSVK